MKTKVILLITCLCLCISCVTIGLLNPPHLSAITNTPNKQEIIEVDTPQKNTVVPSGTYYCIASNSPTLENDYTIEDFVSTLPFIQTDNKGNMLFSFLTQAGCLTTLTSTNEIGLHDNAVAVSLAFGILYHGDLRNAQLSVIYDKDNELITVSFDDTHTYFKLFESTDAASAWLSQYFTTERFIIPRDLTPYTSIQAK